MYIKLKNGQIEKYPYSTGQLRADNPQISFPQNISDSLLAEYEVYPVEQTAYPEVDYSKNVKEVTPVYKLFESSNNQHSDSNEFDNSNLNGRWVQVWEVSDKDYDELLQTILNLRASEYPPMSDYVDGIVKGDQAQVDKYIADCLAVKAKYPKP